MIQKVLIRTLSPLSVILLAVSPVIPSNYAHAEEVKFTCQKKCGKIDAADPGYATFEIGEKIWPGTCDNLLAGLRTYCRKLDVQATQSSTGKRCDPKSCTQLFGKDIKRISQRDTVNCSVEADESWCACVDLPQLPQPATTPPKVKVVFDDMPDVIVPFDELVSILAP